MNIKRFKMLLCLLFGVLLLSCTSARVAQELQRGRSNFENGNYRIAFQQLLPLASEGNREAQYAIGYMYYYGYGVTRDPDTGVFWIKKSAAAGYEPAMRAKEELGKAR